MLLTLLSQQGAPPPVVAVRVWLKVAGIWKETTVYLKVSGVWKTTTPAIKISGTWR
jgi:hypothetical protein